MPEVAAILSNTKGTEAAKRPGLVPHLLNLYDVFKALLQARQARGAIDFETTETYIVCNAAGKIEQIIPRTRNDAHKVIEECMLAANVCAADLPERSISIPACTVSMPSREIKVRQSCRTLPPSRFWLEPGWRRYTCRIGLCRADGQGQARGPMRPCCKPCCCA